MLNWSKLGEALYAHRIAALCGAFFLLFDQLSKDLAYTLWQESASSAGWITLHLSRNPGLAFGFLGGLPGELRVPLILLVSLAAALGISFLSKPFAGSGLRGWGLSLLYAGATGNALDRLSRGYVVDFIEITVWGGAIPAFNLADVLVAVGALMLVSVVFISALRGPQPTKGDIMERQELSTEALMIEAERVETPRAIALFKMMPGTTLVEILVVVAIIGLVMGAVAIGVVPLFTQGQAGTAWNDTKNIENMYTVWQISHTDCPSSADDLIKAAGKKGQSPKDPWGNEYQISCPSQHDLDIDVCSNGQDKQQGTDDDVCNWKPQPKGGK